MFRLFTFALSLLLLVCSAIAAPSATAYHFTVCESHMQGMLFSTKDECDRALPFLKLMLANKVYLGADSFSDCTEKEVWDSVVGWAPEFRANSDCETARPFLNDLLPADVPKGLDGRCGRGSGTNECDGTVGESWSLTATARLPSGADFKKVSNPDAVYTVAMCTAECDADPDCVGFIETVDFNGACMLVASAWTSMTDLSGKSGSLRWNWWAKPKLAPRWYDYCAFNTLRFGGGANNDMCTSAMPHMNALLDKCAAYAGRTSEGNLAQISDAVLETVGACDTNEYNADVTVVKTCLGCTPCSNINCGAGEYRSGECSDATGGYTCTPCANGFFKEGTNNATSCTEKKRVCGDVWNQTTKKNDSFIFKPSDPVASTAADNTCEACPDGTFQLNETECNICAHIECAANEYRTGECSGTTNGFTCLAGQAAADQAFTDLFDIFDRPYGDEYYISNDYNEDWYTDEQKAVMVIAGECGNHQFMPSDAYSDYDETIGFTGSDSCIDEVEGCSFQFVKLPETVAAMKTHTWERLKDSNLQMSDRENGVANTFGVGWWFPLYEDQFDTEMANGGRTICLPDGFQARVAATGWSLDKYYSRLYTCQVHSGDRGACAAAGCGYAHMRSFGNGCVPHSHHGLTSSLAAKEAAAAAVKSEVVRAQKNVDDEQAYVDRYQKEKTAACDASADDDECRGDCCTIATNNLRWAVEALENAKSALSAAEKHALDSATVDADTGSGSGDAPAIAAPPPPPPAAPPPPPPAAPTGSCAATGAASCLATCSVCLVPFGADLKTLAAGVVAEMKGANAATALPTFAAANQAAIGAVDQLQDGNGASCASSEPSGCFMTCLPSAALGVFDDCNADGSNKGVDTGIDGAPAIVATASVAGVAFVAAATVLF